MAPTDFLAGVIEGFYGPPWTQAERLELFGWMAQWGLNTYLYAPKDDLKHRALWREPYSTAEIQQLAESLRACQQRNIAFIYALSPGLDIDYGSSADLDQLRQRFQQMLTHNCQHFALLFDDLPQGQTALEPRGSLAAAQSRLANTMFAWIRARCPQGHFLFCPTPYCGRMAERGLGGSHYLPTLGRELAPEILICWTGPEIISREISVGHIRELQNVLGRKPLIWDNLHANDYDGRRFFCGPYAGRPPELRHEVSGILSNPNVEFPLNYVPLRTLARFVGSPDAWEPRQAYLSAMREWLALFGTVGQPVSLEDLILMGDCYYLPHAEGPEAQALYESLRSLLAAEPNRWTPRALACRQQAGRLRAFCARITELRHRPLFHALSRRLWELREELDLLEAYIASQCAKGPAEARSDSHLPGTYRGGMVPRLQELLAMGSDGAFTAARPSQRGTDSTAPSPRPLPAL